MNRKDIIKTVFFLCLVLGSLSWLSGQKIIKGKITDSNGEPLPEAIVTVKGTKTEAVSDINGNYRVKAKQGQTLTFEFIGFSVKNIVIGKNNQIDVTLKQESNQIENVVKTGYRVLNNNEFTGAAVSLKAADIKVGGIQSVDKLLQGQAAGVSVQNISSVFGSAPKIRIRGTSSITGINEPLWVLDGVVLQTPLNIEPSALYSGNARSLLGSALAGVNPDDIEDITILKDATATALYGTKAVNGVIVITTKRAKKNQKLSLSYNTNTTISLKPTIENFDVLNSEEETDIHEEFFNKYQHALQSFAAKSGGAYTKLLDLENRGIITNFEKQQRLKQIKDINTDWFDVLFRNAVQQQHSISASYGGEKTTGRLSFSYLKDEGFSVGQNVERYTISTANTYSFSNKLSIEGLIKQSGRNQKNPGTRVNPYNYASHASRAMNQYEYYMNDYVRFNILNEIENDYIKIKANDLSLQFKLDYKPWDKWHITLLANQQTSVSTLSENMTEKSAFAQSFREVGIGENGTFGLRRHNEKLYKDPDGSAYEEPNTALPDGGFLSVTNARTETTTIRAQINWKPIENQMHKVDFLAGTESIKSRSSENKLTGFGYIFESGTAIPSELILKQIIRSRNPLNDKTIRSGSVFDIIEKVDVTGQGEALDRDLRNSYYATGTFNRNQLSYYGSLNYSLLDRYVLTFSGRMDATNINDGEFIPTWTVAGAWVLSNEPFMKSIGHILVDTKLRASYGLRGNAGNRGRDFVAYNERMTRTYSKFNETIISVKYPENRSLSPEREYIFNAGINTRLFNLINISADYYHRKNFDLIGFRTVAPSSGYSNKEINFAIVTNQGGELSIQTQPIKLTNALSWVGNFNIGYNQNKVISNYQGNDPTVYTLTEREGYALEGRPIDGLYAFKFAGLDKKGYARYFDPNGKKIYGFASETKDFGNVSYQGSLNPLYTGGFNSTFRYKNFSFGTLFVFNAGHVVRKWDFYRNEKISALFRDDLNVPGDYRDRWRASGNERYTNIPRLLDNREDRNFYATLGIFTDNALRSYNRSDIRTIKASFLRLKNVSLGYNFPINITKRLGVRYLSMRVEGTNLAVFSSKKFRGQDPEALLQGTNIPPVTSFTFNLNIGF